MSDLPLFLGRFHTLLVHLPIGLLLAVGGLEVWTRWLRRLGRSSRAEGAVGPLLGLAAAGAVLAALAGAVLGASGGYSGEAFERHRALGLGLAASAVLTAGAWLLASRRPTWKWRLAYGLLLGHTLVLLAGAGHAGGALGHGEDYLLEFAPPPVRAWLFDEGTLVGERPAGQQVVYEALVHPILARRCVSCHGAENPRGGLRLDSPQGLAAGGDSGEVVDPGRPASSDLWRRVSLPGAHPDVMPPRGHRPLDAAEGALLRWWILEGAPFEATLAEVEVTPEVRPVIEALVGPLPLPGPTLPPARVAAADPETLATAREAGFSVEPVAEEVPFLRVSPSRPAASASVDLSALEPLADQIVWLDLGGSGVDDRELGPVASLTHLVRLDLSRTRVTDEGLAHLVGLPHLESLNLHGTGVTDGGLEQLESLDSLRRVYLWRTATTLEGVDRLRAARPGLETSSGLGAPGPDSVTQY